MRTMYGKADWSTWVQPARWILHAISASNNHYVLPEGTPSPARRTQWQPVVAVNKFAPSMASIRQKLARYPNQHRQCQKGESSIQAIVYSDSDRRQWLSLESIVAASNTRKRIWRAVFTQIDQSINMVHSACPSTVRISVSSCWFEPCMIGIKVHIKRRKIATPSPLPIINSQ